MLRYLLYLLCIARVSTGATLIGNTDYASKVKRETPNEECYNFDWLLSDSSSSTKYYSCCKENSNCTSFNTESKTSSNYECTPFGDTIYRKNITSKFNCGKCEGKKWAMEKCNARWKLAGIDDATDRCWIWSACFKGACAAQEVAYLHVNKTVPQETNFCGDGFCLESTGENADNCPIDCCPTKNSQCAVTSEKCSKPCCSESTCCIDDFDVIYIAILCGGAALVNLLFCCTCFCCYRKIRRVCGFNNKKLSKSISIDNLSRDSPKSTTSMNRKGSPPLNSPAYKTNSLASLNKKVYYLNREHSPRPLRAKSSSLTSLNNKGLSRSTQSLDRIA